MANYQIGQYAGYSVEHVQPSEGQERAVFELIEWSTFVHEAVMETLVWVALVAREIARRAVLIVRLWGGGGPLLLTAESRPEVCLREGGLDCRCQIGVGEPLCVAKRVSHSHWE